MDEFSSSSVFRRRPERTVRISRRGWGSHRFVLVAVAHLALSCGNEVHQGTSKCPKFMQSDPASAPNSAPSRAARDEPQSTVPSNSSWFVSIDSWSNNGGILEQQTVLPRTALRSIAEPIRFADDRWSCLVTESNQVAGVLCHHVLGPTASIDSPTCSPRRLQLGEAVSPEEMERILQGAAPPISVTWEVLLECEDQ